MDVTGADDRPVDLSGPDDPPPVAKKPRRVRRKPAREVQGVDDMFAASGPEVMSPAEWQRLEQRRSEAELKIWKKKVGYIFKLGLIGLVVLSCLFMNVLGDRPEAGGVPVWLVLMMLPMLFLCVD